MPVVRFVAFSVAALVAALAVVLLAPGRPVTAGAAGMPYQCRAQSGGTAVNTPPLRSVTAVRAGAHPGYDRFVMQFDGAVPTYTVQPRSSATFTSDPGGASVTLAGAAGVQVTLHGAASSAGMPASLEAGLSTLKQARRVGDFEGVVTWALGVSRSTCLRVFTLANPSRLVVDVRQYGLPAFTCDGGVLFGLVDDAVTPAPPQLTDVRTGGHPEYDRFVSQFAGPVTYSVRTQASPVFTEEPNGGQVTLLGDSGARVVLNTYSAPGYTGPTDIVTGLPALREARQVGDFYGTVTWGLGLGGPGCVRAFGLQSPTRLVVDVLR
jgi:hypothetical protein